MEGLGERLKEARERSDGHPSARSVAKRLRLAVNTVSKWESGEIRPNPEQLRDVARLYGVSADWLLGLTDEEGIALLATHDEPEQPGDWQSIAMTLAEAIRRREETEQLRVREVEAPRAHADLAAREAERLAQESLRIAIEEAKKTPSAREGAKEKLIEETARSSLATGATREGR